MSTRAWQKVSPGLARCLALGSDPLEAVRALRAVSPRAQARVLGRLESALVGGASLADALESAGAPAALGLALGAEDSTTGAEAWARCFAAERSQARDGFEALAIPTITFGVVMMGASRALVRPLETGSGLGTVFALALLGFLLCGVALGLTTSRRGQRRAFGWPLLRGRIGALHAAYQARRLAALLRAGCPLDQAARALQLPRLAAATSAGLDLAEAMSAEPALGAWLAPALRDTLDAQDAAQSLLSLAEEIEHRIETTGRRRLEALRVLATAAAALLAGATVLLIYGVTWQGLS